ncbi:MAG: hypothetical protein D6744_03315 [Planctomycetota bacterium]|nr:MAG: hypothetical protein D6744_03315 [Planctomycetota bacterium]
MVTNANNTTTNDNEYELTCANCGREVQGHEYELVHEETWCSDCLDSRGPDEEAIEAALLELFNRASMECEEVADVDFTNARASTFYAARLMTRDHGVVLRMANGQEFQISIVQSK